MTSRGIGSGGSFLIDRQHKPMETASGLDMLKMWQLASDIMAVLDHRHVKGWFRCRRMESLFPITETWRASGEL